MMNYKFFWLLFFFFVCHHNGRSQTAGGAMPDSVYVHLADPAIWQEGNNYYLYGTVEGASGNGFLVYTSSDLKSWKLSDKNGGYALKKGDAFGAAGFWAPQVIWQNSRYCMAYVANEKIAIAESNSPLGPFTQTTTQPLAAPVKQIDPFVFMDDDGKRYLYHVRLTNGNKIFVAQLADDFSAILPATLRECINATDAWENTENTGWPVTEGPSVLKHKGTYYLFYTANDFRNPDYAVGYATSKNPLGPWKKYSGNPIISKNVIGHNGTGHGDFFSAGKDLYYVFHTHNSHDKVGPRKTALIKVRFVKTAGNIDHLEIDKNSFRFLKRQSAEAGFTAAGQTAEISWDTTTLQLISPPGSSGSYPRMIQLNNGSLLVAYASAGNVVVTSSNDTGRSWSPPSVVAAKRDSINMDTPDLLQLKNGTLLICYATRPQAALTGHPDSTKRFEIRLQKSSNTGRNWNYEKVLYRAGASFKDGCWEPSLLQMPSGDIQLYFSDEGIYTASNEQNISMLQSADDGADWPASPQIISFREKSRDGMPVPLWLKKEKEIVLAIEDPGCRNFKPYIIRSPAGGKWAAIIGGGDQRREYALRHPIADTIYAGAPYLRQLSTGETILSYQSTEARAGNRDNNAVMRVAVGNSAAHKFEGVTTPFDVPEGYYALWNSLCVLNDDSIIALTSTNGYSKSESEIRMIKGRLKK